VKTIALICARCGAPLPLEAAHTPFATCAYCEATLAIHGSSVTVTATAAGPVRTNAPTASQDFAKDVAEAMAAGVESFQAIRAASARHLGVAGQSEAVARLTMAIARDFERESGVSISRDALALTRITQAYLKAIGELQNAGWTELNLPFLTATPDGPKHYQRRVDPTVIAQLAADQPEAEAKSATPKPLVEPANKKKEKKGWWPF